MESINPYLRFAQTQPSVLEGGTPRKAYDCRLFYAVNGSGHLYLGNNKRVFSSKMLAYIPYGFPYYFEGKIQVIVINFDMTRAFCDKATPISPSVSMHFDDTLIFDTKLTEHFKYPLLFENGYFSENILNEILFEYRFPDIVSSEKCSALLKMLLCDMIRQKHGTDYKRSITNQVTNYIKNNCTENINNNIIAEFFGYNPLYLNRLFKEDTGMTIHKFLLNERISLAKKMLKRSDASIEEIALSCGFNDRSHFCTAFKEAAGQSPAAYRRSNRIF